MSYDPLLAAAAHTHGIFTRRTARGLGISSSGFDRRIKTGKLIKVHRGVYRVSTVARTWQSEALAACLRYGGVASHVTAARLHGLGEFTSTTPDITVAHGAWQPSIGARLHTSRQLHLTTPIEKDGIACTPIDRTILDLGAVLDVNRLTDLTDEAIRRQMLEWRHLYTVLAIHSAHGRNGCGTLRAVLDRQDPAKRVPESKWSRMVERLLLTHGLPKPELEYEIERPDGPPVGRFDLVYPHARLVIELDSRTWHDNAEKFESDRERIRELQVMGWTILPLTWKQFVSDGAGFAAQVAAVLMSRIGVDPSPPDMEATNPRFSGRTGLQIAGEGVSALID